MHSPLTSSDKRERGLTKEFFRQLSFRRKLLIPFVALSYIPVLLMGIAAYHLCTNFIINITKKSSIEAIGLVYGDIDSLLNDAWSPCNMLTGNIKMQEYLHMDFNSIRDRYSNDLTRSMELASVSTYRKDIFGVYVFGQDGGCYRSDYYPFKSEDQRETTWYGAIAGSREVTWFPSYGGSFIIHSSIGGNFITVEQPMMDKTSGMVNSVVAADIKENTITRKIKHSLSNGVICTIDQKGNILSRSNVDNDFRYPTGVSPGLISHILRLTSTAVGESIVMPSSGYLIISRTLMDSNRKIADVIDWGFLTQSSKDITHTVILVPLIIAFSSLYVTIFMSQSVYKPVRILYHMMGGVKNGDFSVWYNYHSSDELRRLGKNFNQILERIQRPTSQIHEEQKKLKNSRPEALQTQIQPHFLHNSLDSVMWLLRMDKNGDTEKILNELSALFKILLSKGDEVITTEKELWHINSYLSITNMIYSRKFEYTIECNPVSYSYRTPKLLLQPLAENTIARVTSMPGQRVFVWVRIYEEEDNLVLSTQNISRGMDQETLESLQQQLGTAVHPDRRNSGYGLYNVNEHIYILFGSNYELTIVSEPDFGTEVTVKIPKLKGDDIFAPGNAS